MPRKLQDAFGWPILASFACLRRQARVGLVFASFFTAGEPASVQAEVFPEDFPCATRSGSKPIRETQLYKAGNPVGIKSLIADSVLSVLLPGIVTPVRPGAIEVGKSVLPG